MRNNDLIKEGDWILLYSSPRAEYLISFFPGKKFSTHLGELVLKEGLTYGEALTTNIGRRFFALKPSTAILSMKVKRTTTIIYPKDAGLIILETGIGAGSKILEVGSGSGALTVILAKAVGKEGMVYSFERREEFLENARKNVERFGLADRVKFILKDPSLEGFGVEAVDTVIVDVPEPWKLVKSAWETLKSGSFWASISPSIEQVQKTWEQLERYFVRLKCLEVLERGILIRPGKTRPRERMVSHTGYLVFAQKIKEMKDS